MVRVLPEHPLGDGAGAHVNPLAGSAPDPGAHEGERMERRRFEIVRIGGCQFRQRRLVTVTPFLKVAGSVEDVGRLEIALLAVGRCLRDPLGPGLPELQQRVPRFRHVLPRRGVVAAGMAQGLSPVGERKVGVGCLGALERLGGVFPTRNCGAGPTPSMKSFWAASFPEFGNEMVPRPLDWARTGEAARARRAAPSAARIQSVRKVMCGSP